MEVDEGMSCEEGAVEDEAGTQDNRETTTSTTPICHLRSMLEQEQPLPNRSTSSLLIYNMPNYALAMFLCVSMPLKTACLMASSNNKSRRPVHLSTPAEMAETRNNSLTQFSRCVASTPAGATHMDKPRPIR